MYGSRGTRRRAARGKLMRHGATASQSSLETERMSRVEMCLAAATPAGAGVRRVARSESEFRLITLASSGRSSVTWFRPRPPLPPRPPPRSRQVPCGASRASRCWTRRSSLAS
eukprot:scaffold41536_cov63-Phaeocystis_antarctica.AAC.1